MKIAFTSVCLLTTLFLSPLAVSSAYADQIDNPFAYFNVYSLTDINYTGSDFQGKAGAGGNVKLSSFSLSVLEQGGYALHAKGSVELGSGSYYGSVEAGQDIAASSMGIYGDLHAGGDISLLGGGTLTGEAYAEGTVSALPYFNTHSGVSFSPVVDLAAVSSYFSTFSTNVGAMGDTGSIVNNYGHLEVNALSGVNVFSLDAATLNSAYAFTVNGPDDAVVYINVHGSGTVNLNSTNWHYNGIKAGNVLVNYDQASGLSLTHSNNVNILAPLADTSFYGGVLTGNLIVGNLQGNGQVNLGHFNDNTPVPEPATFLLLGSGLAGLAGLRRKTKGRG